MKGYFEERGKAFKLEFDVASGTFVSTPEKHSFAPEDAPRPLLQKLNAMRQQRQKTKTEQTLLVTLAGLGPEARDDVGMSGVYTALQQP